MNAIEQLKNHLGEIHDLKNASHVLGWDQQTYMPSGGGEARAHAIGTLERLSHEKFASADTARLLDAAERETQSAAHDSDEACLIRITRRDYEKSRKLPDEFVAAWARDAIRSNEVWRHARGANDFAAFQPHLEKMLDYARRQADYYGYADHPYDALLDDYEPEMKTAQVRAIFAELRREQVPLAQKWAQASAGRSDFLNREYSPQQQGEIGLQMAQAFGYDTARGRLDIAPHPFCTNFGRDDVRITTRYDKNQPAQAIFGIFHETGHALYEQNTAPALARTPLAAGASMMFHESQSRLWENIVGRSLALWQHFWPQFQAAFPHNLADVSAEEWYRAINRVESSLIRVEADEVTYNLHIMLRFDLEVAMLAGDLEVRDLPEAWRAKMQEYFAMSPPDDRDGVMQDTHWSSGSFGYFPTYALGNLMSAQIWNTARAAAPGIEDELARGEFSTLRGWLTDNLYVHGRKFLPPELALKVTGRPLEAAPYLNYLKLKYNDLCSISASGVEQS